MNRADYEGDPWVAEWAAPDGTAHHLYEPDVALLRQVAAGKVEVHDRAPKWVYVAHSRRTTRDPETKVFRRLVEIGIIVAGEPERVRPNRPDLSTAGLGYMNTPYHLADGAAEAMLTAVR